ncbi:MAG: Lipid A biosynthesis lauroyltransferase, partial [Chlamydiae bacterium]|nr:Lipid A biosynthesis lauroyltransferase [Chlamydiota bacterium]
MISYLLIRIFTLPFAFLPFKLIHLIGRAIGNLAYTLHTRYRKRALSNLSLAGLHDIKKTAKASFQNLAITCLEYAKFARLKNTDKVLSCENPELAKKLIDRKQGIIFFCGHQANWELLFIEGTRRMPGVAIGRPIKNRRLYQWILSIREKFGGTIIPPKKALREG